MADHRLSQALRLMWWVRVLLVAQVIVLLALGTTAIFFRSEANRARVQTEASIRATALAARGNRTAIEVGCNLLANAIVQSGVAQRPGVDPGPQAQLSALYLGALRRGLTPSEIIAAADLTDRVRRSGGVTIPPCHEIALHPQTFKAVEAEAARKAKRGRP